MLRLWQALLVIRLTLCLGARADKFTLRARGRDFLQLDEIPSFQPTAFPVAEPVTTQEPSEAPKFFVPTTTPIGLGPAPTESPISIADTPSDVPVAVEPTPEPIADFAPSSAPIGLGPAPTESPISIADTPSAAPIAVKPTADIESTPTTSPVELPTSSPVDFPTSIASEREIYYHQTFRGDFLRFPLVNSTAFHDSIQDAISDILGAPKGTVMNYFNPEDCRFPSTGVYRCILVVYSSNDNYVSTVSKIATALELDPKYTMNSRMVSLSNDYASLVSASVGVPVTVTSYQIANPTLSPSRGPADIYSSSLLRNKEISKGVNETDLIVGLVIGVPFALILCVGLCYVCKVNCYPKGTKAVKVRAKSSDEEAGYISSSSKSDGKSSSSESSDERKEESDDDSESKSGSGSSRSGSRSNSDSGRSGSGSGSGSSRSGSGSRSSEGRVQSSKSSRQL